MRFLISLLLIILCQFAFVAHVPAAEIALIIDDIGNKDEDILAFNLPTNVTFAILPNKPLSKVFSERASMQNREVIIHMPMESLAGVKQEEYSLVVGMSADKIRTTLASALRSVPFATGLNNHMGSRLTQLDKPMTVTMSFLLEHGMYFVDSRTTRYSLAEKVAHKTGVLATKRDVFLDHQVDLPSIRKQFNRLINLAKKQGSAVAIAHPHPETLDFLAENLPIIKSYGISLVKLSEIVIEQANVAKTYDPSTNNVVTIQ